MFDVGYTCIIRVVYVEWARTMLNALCWSFGSLDRWIVGYYIVIVVGLCRRFLSSGQIIFDLFLKHVHLYIICIWIYIGCCSLAISSPRSLFINFFFYISFISCCFFMVNFGLLQKKKNLFSYFNIKNSHTKNRPCRPRSSSPTPSTTNERENQRRCSRLRFV